MFLQLQAEKNTGFLTKPECKGRVSREAWRLGSPSSSWPWRKLCLLRPSSLISAVLGSSHNCRPCWDQGGGGGGKASALAVPFLLRDGVSQPASGVPLHTRSKTLSSLCFECCVPCWNQFLGGSLQSWEELKTRSQRPLLCSQVCHQQAG